MPGWRRNCSIPRVREALRDEDLVDEAEDQHGSQREFVAQILATQPEDALYDARVAVLGRNTSSATCAQEREQVFNRVLASRMDLQSLGRSITIRKEELRVCFGSVAGGSTCLRPGMRAHRYGRALSYSLRQCQTTCRGRAAH